MKINQIALNLLQVRIPIIIIISLIAFVTIIQKLIVSEIHIKKIKKKKKTLQLIIVIIIFLII